MSKIKDFSDSSEIEEFRKAWKEHQEQYKAEATELWNNLSYDDRLKVFYHVVSKIHESDVVERGSYRYCLYEKFSFDMDAYTLGLDAGYMDLHNIIYDGCDYGEFKFAKNITIKNDDGEFSFEFPDSHYLDFDFDKETETLTIKSHHTPFL